MVRPRHPKPDSNQARIIRELEAVGCAVLDISAICGVADILVWAYDWQAGDHRWRLFELKTDEGELTDAEREFQDRHPGAVHMARNMESVLAWFGRA